MTGKIAMKNYILLLLTFFFFSCSNDDEEVFYLENIFEGNVVLPTQQEVNDFGANNYTQIIRSVFKGSQWPCTINGPGNELNEMLTDLCAIQGIIASGNYQTIEIDGNAYNPTVEDFIAGDCSI